MTKIEVLGPGCQKCQVLYEHTKAAVEQLGIECTVEKVTDIRAIMSYGVLSTPALVVDGQVKVAGRVPTAAQIQEMLT
jgi:small redox-active disulfide protein 2